MPKISQIEIFNTSLPFRHAFSHSLKSRSESESIFVKVLLDNGISGFGEALPRVYVTGNTQYSVFNYLKDYAGKVIGVELDDDEESISFIKNLEGIEAEARCALELALLDCLGKVSSKPVSKFLGETVSRDFTYSLIVPSTSVLKAGLICAFAKFQGYGFIKVKVGSENDLQIVKVCRQMLPSADIRVDANGVWGSGKAAIGQIEKLRPFRISSIEQPVPKEDFKGLKEVADACTEPVIADESLCSMRDAQELSRSKACDMFNIRLSKCGGIFRSLDIMKTARDNGLAYQLGCLVGETGILTAAARHMASTLKDIKYFEGSYSRFLLKEDCVEEDLTPVKSIGHALDKNGLGVTVKEDIIRKYSAENMVIK